MSDDKVLRFPTASSVSRDLRCVVPSPLQPSLFDHRDANHGRIVFIDIAWLAEDSLLNLVAKNDVTALIDLRPRPVFERPRFRHRHVVRYFYERNVRYLEFAMLARDARNTGFFSSPRQADVEARFCEMLSRGLTFLLYDDSSRSAGWIDDVRSLMRNTPGYLAEVHPRALVGALETAGRR